MDAYEILKLDTQTISSSILDMIKESPHVFSVKSLGISKLKPKLNCYCVQMTNWFSIMVYCKN